MLALILAAILGSGVVYFSMQNQLPVTVQLGSYMWSNIPVYFVALAGLLVGLGIAWLVSTVDSIASAMTIMGKEGEVKQLRRRVVDLQTKVRDYSIENARLKGDKHAVQSDLAKERIDHTRDRARGWFDRLRYRLTN